MERTDLDAEYEKVMKEHYRAQTRHEFWYGLFSGLKQWARYEDNYSLTKLQRAFYTIKATICLLIHRQRSYWARDYITIGIFDEIHVGPCGGALPEWASDWTQLVVGVGFSKEWFFDIFTDSNC